MAGVDIDRRYRLSASERFIGSFYQQRMAAVAYLNDWLCSTVAGKSPSIIALSRMAHSEDQSTIFH